MKVIKILFKQVFAFHNRHLSTIDS